MGEDLLQKICFSMVQKLIFPTLFQTPLYAKDAPCGILQIVHRDSQSNHIIEIDISLFLCFYRLYRPY
jgi:hypothetical protein